MALNNNLVVSWNFDTLTGSDGAGSITVLDISNNHSGYGTGFSVNSNSFLLKEELKNSKRLIFDVIESEDTIQIIDDEDERISDFKKPSSLSLIIENSMYQHVSEEMLNLFSSVNRYALKFSSPNNKYKTNYESLDILRKQFFENVLEKPNLEKYIEFYKWLDSSLGALLDQLKPENSTSIKGLKTTVESHILERNKYAYPLPLTFQEQKIFKNSSPVEVVTKTTGSSNSKSDKFLTSSSGINVVSVENVNYTKAYDFLQTAGKSINNRGDKQNKTVFQTRFSSVDGLSELNKDSSGEYSVYNETNQRARNIRNSYNITVSQQTGTQGNNAINGDFQDNGFIQRNIPYTASHYANTGSLNSQIFSNEQLSFNKANNLLVEVEDQLLAIVEPPVEFNIPSKINLTVDGAFEEMEIYAPYHSQFNTFTKNFLNSGSSIYFNQDIFPFNDQSTFFRKSLVLNSSGSVKVRRWELLDNVYPAKHLVGLAESRTKPDYNEGEGTYNEFSGAWTQSSYNRNPAVIKTFWRDSLEDRRRTRGADYFNNTGSINTLGAYNLSQSSKQNLANFNNYKVYENGASTPFSIILSSSLYNNIFDSVYSFDSNINNNITGTNTAVEGISYTFSSGSENQIGELSPLPHSEKIKFLITSSVLDSNIITPRPKAEFIFNNFPGLTVTGSSTAPDIIYAGVNNSYQNSSTGLVPFYDSYESYFKNIKSKSTNYSIISEFNVSDYDQIIKSDTDKTYISGSRTFLKNVGINDLVNDETTIKIEKNSNKIKIVFNGIKKLLPYNGFYPSDRAKQLINYFYEGYISSSNLDAYETQTLLQPFFAPGIFFNTVKSGLATSYPTLITSSGATVYDTPVTGNYNSYDTRSYSVNNINKNFDFTTILSPEAALSSSSTASLLYYLDGTNQNTIFSSGSTIKQPTLQLSKLKINASKYKSAINNYLAEIPNFFLTNRELTNLQTVTEDQFEEVESGKTYKMRVYLEKSPTFSHFYSSSAPRQLPVESLFGPAVYLGTQLTSSRFSSSAYYPYAPPYLRGDTTGSDLNYITLTYTANETGKPTIDKIFGNLVIENNNNKYSNIYALTQSMKISDCIKIKGRKFEYTNTVDDNGAIISRTLDKARWRIQTLFETPLINYSSLNNTQYNSSSFEVNYVTSALAPDTLTVQYNPTNYNGVWNSLGAIPDIGNSIQIRLDDSAFGEESLLKIVKFQETEASIGIIADSKTISEAIVLVPFTNPLRRPTRDGRNVIATNERRNESLDRYRLASKYTKFGGPLFAIDNKIVNKLLNVTNYKSLSLAQIKNKLETDINIDKGNSIVQLMEKMVKYNIPPHLNWLDNRQDLDPFVMYIAEFTHALTKEDLANIWQGTMPTIATVPQEETVIIEHEFKEDELFSNLNLDTVIIKAKVFKCKLRAQQDYLELTNPYPREVEYVNRGKWYTYNWPYDYFSLVELVNVQAGGVYELSGTNE